MADELTRGSTSEAEVTWFRRVETRADWRAWIGGKPEHVLVTHEEMCGFDDDVADHVHRVVAMLTASGVSEEYDDLRISVAVTYREEPAR